MIIKRLNKDAKQQACAPSSLILACYFPPVKAGDKAKGSMVRIRKANKSDIDVAWDIRK